MRSGARKTTTSTKHLLFKIFNSTADSKIYSGLATATTENPVLHAIFNSNLMAIAIADDNNDFIEVNTGFCTLFGYTKKELVGKPIDILLSSIHHEKKEGTITIAIEESEMTVAFNGVLRHSCKNGSHKDVEVTSQTFDHNGKKVSLISAVDITGRKSAEEQVKHSEARLIEAQEVAKVGSWETDLSTLAVTWSLQTYRIFGIEPDSFATSHPGFLTFVHPDDRGMVDKAFIDSLQSDAVNIIEHRICTTSSEIKIVEERWRIFRNEEGMPVRAVGTCQDITERKIAAQKISDSELRYRSLIEQATDAICITDAAMHIIDINPSGCQLLGYGKEEFLKLSLADLFYAEDLITSPFKTDALQTGKVVSNERRFKRKDGTGIELEINVKLLDDGRVVGFARDITARKQAEKELQAAYIEKDTILESIADAFFAVDKNWMVTYWNKEAEKMLHTPKHTIVGRHLWEVFSGSIDSESYKQYHRALTTNQHIVFEDYYAALNRWFEISAYPSASGLSVYFKDVTERKQAAQLVIESEAKYRTLFEQNVAGVYQTTVDGVILNCNDAFAKMLKYDSPKELLLKNASELYFSPAERNDFVNTVITQKKIHNYESTLKCKDGSSLHFIENISLRKDELTGEAFFDGILIDISEKKRAEVLLKESNRRYNLISKATNDMVWDWDLATGKVYRNKEGWRKIFRTAPNEIENGLTGAWEERIHPEDLEKVQRITDAIQEAEQNFFEVECRVRRDDGTYAYVHDRAYIVRDADGRATRLIGATQDITSRKEAELKVAKSELRFRSLIQNGSDLTSILDDKGNYLYSSPAIKNILGYEPEFIFGKNAFSFIHPEDVITIKAHLAKKEKGDCVDFVPFRFKNTLGEWRWLESKVSNQCDNPGVQGYVFNSRDVTERKIADEKINKLSIIARETMNGVVMTDIDGKIIWVNEAFTRITEFEFNEAMGKKPGDFLHGAETDSRVVNFMRRELKKVKAFECDIINYKKSGKSYWVRIQCQPQFDESGKLNYFFAIQTDITKEKQAEKILKSSEERYRYLFNNNPASIFIWDIHSLQILEVNDNAVDLYGYNRKEFLTKTVKDISLIDDYKNIEQFCMTALYREDFKQEITCKHIAKSGEEMHMHIDSHRIQFKGRPVILALATNITDKILLEKLLEQEKLAKQKEITTAVITAQEQERQELGSELHDNINQILAGSLLYLGLAKKECKDANAYLNETEILVSSAIDEIRKLSHSLIPPSLTQSEFLEALSNIIQATEKSSGIMICLQAAGFDESIVCDKMKLNIYRIIQEQFTNILKHAHAEKIMVHLTQENEKTILSVKDDGIGFDTSKKPGGVGLMNIKTRASLFNGEVTIISSPGKGCEVKVIFNTLPGE
ncbi:PAS domain S-box protein [Ferruginibacter sp. SUN106]|uniref:sensor histidine kinase n=1 Tax=Ferruginibacter sp. SUN106 TaxID=2978348 RepID=UPI003D362CBC